MSEPAAPPPSVLQAGGALGLDKLYVERPADRELHRALSAGEFCYVLAPRQSGKSSLRVRTAARLRAAGAKLGVPSRHVEAAIDAFHFLQLLRLRLQDEASSHTSANRIDPDRLNDVDQLMLKEAFRQAKKLQQLLEQTFQS